MRTGTECGNSVGRSGSGERTATETVESTETVAEGTEATAENTETADGTLVRVASLKGPTSLGLLFLMNKSRQG